MEIVEKPGERTPGVGKERADPGYWGKMQGRAEEAQLGLTWAASPPCLGSRPVLFSLAYSLKWREDASCLPPRPSGCRVGAGISVLKFRGPFAVQPGLRTEAWEPEPLKKSCLGLQGEGGDACRPRHL
jgi:hypothetical protein